MGKICTKCGTENGENAKFCHGCGASLAEQGASTPEIKPEPRQETKPNAAPEARWEAKSNTAPEPRHAPKPKAASKGNAGLLKKLVLVVVILAIVSGGGFAFYKIGMYVNSSDKYIQKFASAIEAGDYAGAYAMLPVAVDTALTAESFQNTYQPLQIAKCEVGLKMNRMDGKTFQIVYKDAGEQALIAYDYEVTQQAEKKLFLFPTWKITKTNMIAENLTVTAPQNAVVSIDGAALDAQSMQPEILNYESLDTKPSQYQENWAVYHIPALWSVAHTVSAAEALYDPFETAWNPLENQSLELLAMQYTASEQWRNVYAAYIRENMDALTASEFSGGNYNSACGFFDVDGDGMPEMFLAGEAYSESSEYSVYTIRDGAVQHYATDNGYALPITVISTNKGDMYFTTDHRLLIASVAPDWMGQYAEYTLENGSMAEKTFAYYFEHADENGGNQYYDASGDADAWTEVSLKEFKKLLKQHNCSFKKNQIRISGDALVNFYDIFTFYLRQDAEYQWYFLDEGAEVAAEPLAEDAEVNYHIDRILGSYNLLSAANAVAIKDGKPVDNGAEAAPEGTAPEAAEPSPEDTQEVTEPVPEDTQAVTETAPEDADADITPDSVEASSVLAPQGKKSYTGKKLIDGKYSTAWVEGVEGVGIGESITLHWKNAVSVSGLALYNGYLASKELYDKNGKVTKVRVDFGNDTIIEKDIYVSDITDFGKDSIEKNCATYINLDEAVSTDRIIITILDAEMGTECDDTAISEIQVY